MYKKWTEKELNWLIENANKFTAYELAEKLERSYAVINVKCSQLKLKYIPANKDKFWLQSEKDFLIEHSQLYTCKELVKYFNDKYSLAAIKKQLRILGVKCKQNEAFWTNDEDEWLKKNSSLYNLVQLTEQLNRTSRAIQERCYSLGVKYKRSDIFWTYDELNIVKEHCTVKTLSDLITLLPNRTSIKSLRDVCKELGLIPLDNRINHSTKHDWLDALDEPSKVYFLMWFHTDGYLDIKKNFIRFGITDREILVLFNQWIHSDTEINEVKTKIGCKKLYKWGFSSKQISNSLQKLGYNNNKTFTAKFPDIPKHLLYHAIRGFIDGDGCVHVTKKCNTITLRVTLTGNENTLLKIKEIFSINTNVIKSKSNNYCILTINGKVAYEFLSKVYEKSEGVRLERKYQKYVEYCNLKNLPIST